MHQDSRDARVEVSLSFPLSQVPYDDLHYLFGEIMYGGHITDDWDRRLCRTYLEEFIKPEMLLGELCLAPGFLVPGNMDYNGYHQVRLCSFLPKALMALTQGLLFPRCSPTGPGALRAGPVCSVGLSPKFALFSSRAIGFLPSNINDTIEPLEIFSFLMFGSIILFVALFYK